MDKMYEQKIKFVVKELAGDLLLLDKGDKIKPISHFQEKYKVARGTIQNAYAFLKENGAVDFDGKGRTGLFIKEINYSKLQSYCMTGSLMGVMPMSNTITSQGLATALYKALNNIDCDLVYMRGGKKRIRMVMDSKCHFAVCSLNTAQIAMTEGCDAKILYNFGPNSFLPRHIIIFKDSSQNTIQPGMRVAYDPTSVDHCNIMDVLLKDIEGVQRVTIKAYQTMRALRDGVIDAALWNIDEALEDKNSHLHYVFVDCMDTEKFTTAVLIVKYGDIAIEKILLNYINPEQIKKIQKSVIRGEIYADF
ncbi:MAG: ABC transporter substrate-binding protein [Chloroflexi bacterium]|jgi:DNA-binding transcriptional regulator YhcF (GntR family)|nr:ABC transporter substrate-binding protein [Chloroflexota bacterium]